MNGISNDQDVMDYALNKASEEALKNSLQQETKNFIHNYLKDSFNWIDLAQEWRNHRFSYNEDAEKSEKSKHAVWAKKQSDEIELLLEPSRKFMSQLDTLFSNPNYQISIIFQNGSMRLMLIFINQWMIWFMKSFGNLKK